MTLRMLVTEESPSKIILRTNPAYNQERGKTYASSTKSGNGCMVILGLGLAILLIIFLSSSFSSLAWGFWLWATIFIVASIIFVPIHISFINSNKNFPHDTIIIIDLDSQQAMRTDKLNSGKEVHSEIRLNEISRVLIDVQAAGHSCRLMFESKNNKPFEVNSAIDFEAGLVTEIGKKLGELLNKPVILKYSEGSKVESEQDV